MRILFLHQYFCPPGGIGNNRSFELGKNMQDEGHTVEFLTSGAYFPESLKAQIPTNGFKTFDFEGLKVHVMGVEYSHMMPFRERILAFLKFYRKGMKALRNRFDKDKFDLIYASSTPPTVGEMGRKLSREWKIPFVYECVDVWPDVPIGMEVIRNAWAIHWLNKRINAIYEEAAAIVALSEGMRDQILSHGPWEDKTVVIHNGTNPEQFPYVGPAGQDGFHAIYTGTVGKANGLHHLVEACDYLQRWGHKDIRISVLGKGNDLERVMELAQERKLKNLHFIPPVPKEEVADFLASADAGIVCFDNFPVLEANSANKFYDYLSAGLPVILNYKGWQADYIFQANCGYFTDQGYQDFALKIVRMARHSHAERVAMGQRGRALVLEKFDRRVLTKNLLKVFQEVLSSAESS